MIASKTQKRSTTAKGYGYGKVRGHKREKRNTKVPEYNKHQEKNEHYHQAPNDARKQALESRNKNKKENLSYNNHTRTFFSSNYGASG